MNASPRSPALAAVRDATRALHDDIERRLVLARPDAGRAEYCTYASALYGWMATWEASLWSGAWPSGLDAAARDNKRAWLRADLEALQAPLPTHFCAAPPLDTLAARFGVAYVLEGSQLGGQVLARRLATSLAPHVPRYLVGYDQLGARWKSFLGALDHHIVIATDIELCARAAHDTFDSLARWFTEHGAARPEGQRGEPALLELTGSSGAETEPA